ncbi:hypothetical protein C0993_006839 [Termitomyces sp. T159_Od127]|nr:hypothetical protein C0993_006839 [Termitomyces sp. T159_Od127]
MDPTSSNLVNQSAALFEWFPPTPPPGDPPHRHDFAKFDGAVFIVQWYQYRCCLQYKYSYYDPCTNKYQ